MQNLLYVSELDNLHMQQSLTAFDGCSKEGLVRGIWRNHSHDKKVHTKVHSLLPRAPSNQGRI